MTINDGGSDKDTLLNTFTGNTLPYPTSSTGNQMFVSYTNNDNINTCFDTCNNPTWKSDGFCDDANNNCGCEWDGGDCCGSNVNTNYCSACECLDPIAARSQYASNQNTAFDNGFSASFVFGKKLANF